MSKGSFRRGADAAAAAAKSSGFARTQFFGIEDGDEAILRFLTDAHEDPNNPHVEAWITVDQHQMVPTKQKPDGWDGNWPKAMGAVCRYDPAFAGVYDDCYICDHLVDGDRVRKPSSRMWALACLREKVLEDGKLVGLTDQTREITIPAKEAKDGQEAREEKTVTEKAIVAVNMGWKNFFNSLQGFGSAYGTVLDRDYWIKRSGASTDTTYQIVGLDVIPGHDLRDPDVAAKYESNYDLAEIISNLASDEFYGKFFDPRFTWTKGGELSKSDVPVEQQAKPDGDVNPEKLKALADRVKGYSSKSEENGGEAEEPAAAATGLRNLD